MAQQPVLRIFVVRTDFKGRQQFPDGPDNGVRLLIFDPADVHRDNLVGTFFVNAGDYLPFLPSEYRMHLIPVIKRVFHPDDAPHRAVPVQQRLQLFLLHPQLLLIGHVQILAAAAHPEDRAKRRLLFRMFFFFLQWLRRSLFCLRLSSGPSLSGGFRSPPAVFSLLFSVFSGSHHGSSSACTGGPALFLRSRAPDCASHYRRYPLHFPPLFV